MSYIPFHRPSLPNIIQILARSVPYEIQNADGQLACLGRLAWPIYELFSNLIINVVSPGEPGVHRTFKNVFSINVINRYGFVGISKDVLTEMTRLCFIAMQCLKCASSGRDNFVVRK